MSLPSFMVAANALELRGNVDGSEIVGNGMGGATPAKATFTSNIPLNAWVTWDGGMYKVAVVEATVGSDGAVLRNGETVRLLANDAGLNVDGITWTAVIGGMQPITFTAPADGETVDLLTMLSEVVVHGGSPSGSTGDIIDGGAP